MNGVFSPDGTKIVFMGDKKKGQRNWDIFLWTVGGGEPVNLTNGGGRDEDPKFSPDGTKIVFKSDNGYQRDGFDGNHFKQCYQYAEYRRINALLYHRWHQNIIRTWSWCRVRIFTA